MRIYVRVNKGSKELYEELLSVDPDKRAERLRTLASNGLLAQKFANQDGLTTPTIQTRPSVEKKTSGIAGGLLKSLDSDD